MSGKYEIKCIHCGKITYSNDKRKKFCDIKCANRYHGLQSRKNRICKQCGEPFHKRSMWGVVFCGPDCRKKWNEEHRKPKPEKAKKEKVLHILNCRICNKEVKRYIIPKDILCNDCRYELHKQKLREKYKKEEFKSKSFICKNCGEKINTELGDTRSVFCCPECADAYGKKEERKTEAFKKKNKERKVLREKMIISNFVEEVSYEKVYERDRGICQICGLPVRPDAHGTGYWDGTMDHKTPLSLGGAHSMENIQLSHRCCNSFKNQSLGDYKIDWYKKSNENNYFAKRFNEYKEMMKDIA